jgi:hypothetical protein
MKVIVEELPKRRTAVRPVRELVCSCGITFEPPPWHDPDDDEPLCIECAGPSSRMRSSLAT